MVNYLKLKGMYIPIVTPFRDDNNRSVDEETLRGLVHYLIDVQKANGLVPCGTTGEAPTLTTEEHKRVIEIVVEEVNGKVPVIAGAGSNDTVYAIEMTKFAVDIGADAALHVSPYYNRPSQEGIIAHFKAISKASDIPIILYNIPMRTGRNMEPKTIIKLWQEVPNIIGLKDACNDNFQLEEVLMTMGEGNKPFYVLAGEDRNTYATLCLGGHGVIAAAGHIVGQEYSAMCKLMLERMEKDYQEKALNIHYKTLEVVNGLFMEPNPAPVKAALHIMGILPNDIPRLPLLIVIDINI